MEHTCKTVISFIDRWVKYIGRNVTKKHGRPYLLSYSHVINLLENSTQNRLGLRYTTLLINNNRHTHGENLASRSAVNFSFRRLQPKMTKNHKIQQGTKNERNRKEAGYRQAK